MYKLIIKLIFLLIGVSCSASVLSQVYRACSEGGPCSYTTAPGYFDPFIPANIPNGTMFGTTYSSEAHRAMMEARRAGWRQCLASVESQFFNNCEIQAKEIQHNDMKVCNSYAAVGGTTAAVGGVVAAAVAGVVVVGTAPVSVPIMILGSVGLIGLGGGTYASSVGNGQCKDDANWLYHINTAQICPANAKKAATEACKQFEG